MTKTRQEIFDIAYRGLASQGFEQSVSEDDEYGFNVCKYRGDGGLKCAIGWLIPDDRYRPGFEKILSDFAEVLAAADISIGDKTFCDDLQEAHDEAESPDSMRANLAAFAEEWGLTIPEVSP